MPIGWTRGRVRLRWQVALIRCCRRRIENRLKPPVVASPLSNSSIIRANLTHDELKFEEPLNIGFRSARRRLPQGAEQIRTRLTELRPPVAAPDQLSPDAHSVATVVSAFSNAPTKPVFAIIDNFPRRSVTDFIVTDLSE
jgi:hypothetical protein